MLPIYYLFQLKPKTNGFNALLSLADNPIKAKRIAQKDVYSSKSVVLTNTNDKNLEFGDIDQYPPLEVILVGIYAASTFFRIQIQICNLIHSKFYVFFQLDFLLVSYYIIKK